MAKNEILQIVVFSIFFGVALAALGVFARFPPGLPSSLARCARIAPQSRPGDAREHCACVGSLAALASLL